jgi:hypothetical protein
MEGLINYFIGIFKRVYRINFIKLFQMCEAQKTSSGAAPCNKIQQVKIKMDILNFIILFSFWRRWKFELP